MSGMLWGPDVLGGVWCQRSVAGKRNGKKKAGVPRSSSFYNLQVSGRLAQPQPEAACTIFHAGLSADFAPHRLAWRCLCINTKLNSRGLGKKAATRNSEMRSCLSLMPDSTDCGLGSGIPPIMNPPGEWMLTSLYFASALRSSTLDSEEPSVAGTATSDRSLEVRLTSLLLFAVGFSTLNFWEHVYSPTNQQASYLLCTAGSIHRVECRLYTQAPAKLF